MSKKRSAAYASISLFETEKFVVSVFDKVGDTSLQYADLAKHGNVPVRDVDQYASTASQYGWMTKIYGKGCSANSAICKALRTPKDEQEKNKLYLNAFAYSVLYKSIISDFNGKTLTEEGLKIHLIREQEFTDIGAKNASGMFIQNAKALGLIDSDNILNIDADIIVDVDAIKPKKIKANTNTSTTKKDSVIVKNKPEIRHEPPAHNSGIGTKKKIPIFVRGEELTLHVLDDMNQNDWDAIIKQIQNIKSYASR